MVLNARQENVPAYQWRKWKHWQWHGDMVHNDLIIVPVPLSSKYGAAIQIWSTKAKKNNAAKTVRLFIVTVKTDSILCTGISLENQDARKLTRLTPTAFKSFMVARCFLSPRSYNLRIFCYIFKMFIWSTFLFSLCWSDRLRESCFCRLFKPIQYTTLSQFRRQTDRSVFRQIKSIFLACLVW